MCNLIGLLPMVAVVGVFYFLMMKPQKKAADEKKKMMNALKKGDSIVTIGGLHGEIDEINESDKTVVLDCDGIYLTFERAAIARVTNSAPMVAETIVTEETVIEAPADSVEEVVVEEKTETIDETK